MVSIAVGVGDLVYVGQIMPQILAGLVPLHNGVDAVLVGAQPVDDGATLQEVQ